MEFDKSKVYTVLNADELKVGSKVIVGDNLLELKECVLKHKLPKMIKKVEPEDSEHRFLCDDSFHYALAYLVSEPLNELKKRIEELEEENAELNEQNRSYEQLIDTGSVTLMKDRLKNYKQLTEAKEIIEGLLNIPDLIEDRTSEHTELIGKAEQFLKEVKENA